MLLASLRYQLYKFSQATFSSWAWAPLEPVSDLFRYLKQTKGAECWGWPSFSMIVLICDPLEAPMAFFEAGFGPALKHHVVPCSTLARLTGWCQLCLQSEIDISVDISCISIIQILAASCLHLGAWAGQDLCSARLGRFVFLRNYYFHLFPSISMLSWSRIALFLCTL